MKIAQNNMIAIKEPDALDAEPIPQKHGLSANLLLLPVT